MYGRIFPIFISKKRCQSLVNNKVVFSLVIHDQSSLVEPLINDLFTLMKDISMKVILRVNTHEDISILNRFLSDPRLIVIFNLEQHGYGRNHNLNFDLEKSDYFVVLNPDIRLICNKIDLLTRHFSSADVGVVAPAVVSSDYSLEDSIRRFPSVAALIKRYAFKLDVGLERRALLGSKVDWCAGMFMVFSSESFRLVKGFDTKYFMYLEDADICLRLRYKAKRNVVYEPSYVCIHNAQRASRSISKALFWHISSLLKFQMSYICVRYFGNH